MSAHTPGPWQAEPGGCVRAINPTAGIRRVNGLAQPQVALAMALHEDRPSDERDANARLIAAAPDLLAALEEMLATHPAAFRQKHSIDNRTDAAVTLARAAIAKARGDK